MTAIPEYVVRKKDCVMVVIEVCATLSYLTYPDVF